MRGMFVVGLVWISGFAATGMNGEEATAYAAAAAPALPQPPPSSSPMPYLPAFDAERASHVRQAAEHLQAAGFDSLAEHVRGLALPSCLNGIERRPAATRGGPQVLLAVKFIELDAELLPRFGLKVTIDGEKKGKQRVAFMAHGTSSWAGVTVVGPDPGLATTIESLRKECRAHVLCEPILVTLNDRPASIQVGSLEALPGASTGAGVGQQRTGLHLELMPDLLENGRLRLEVRCHYAEPDPIQSVAVNGDKLPGVSNVDLDTAVEMKLGQTLAASWPAVAASRESKPPALMRLVLVTPELVQPAAVGPQPMPTMAPAAKPTTAGERTARR